MTQSLIDGNELRERLVYLFPKTKQHIVIAAYLTLPAVEWFKSLLAQRDDSQVVIICRMSPSDLASGATDIKALKLVLTMGWELKILTNLHAKIYLLDQRYLFVGSANFTANGLTLIGNGNGNFEAMTELKADEKAILFVQRIIAAASFITSDILTQMAALLQTNSNDAKFDVALNWPEGLIEAGDELFVADFPLAEPGSMATEYALNTHLPFAIIEHLKDDPALASQAFIASKAYQWLQRTLREKGEGGMYYGALTAALHNDLADDPAPYRRNVKYLLTNLLQYVALYAAKKIQVSRPRHSQLVTLLL